MSAHTEVEICCDGADGGTFFCTTPPLFARTAAKARKSAREFGWLVAQPGGKDYCPRHRPAGFVLAHLSTDRPEQPEG